MSESTGRTSAGILIEPDTFVIHYLETTYAVSLLRTQAVLTPVLPELARHHQETCNYAKRGLIIFPPGNSLAYAY